MTSIKHNLKQLFNHKESFPAVKSSDEQNKFIVQKQRNKKLRYSYQKLLNEKNFVKKNSKQEMRDLSSEGCNVNQLVKASTLKKNGNYTVNEFLGASNKPRDSYTLNNQLNKKGTSSFGLYNKEQPSNRFKLSPLSQHRELLIKVPSLPPKKEIPKDLLITTVKNTITSFQPNYLTTQKINELEAMIKKRISKLRTVSEEEKVRKKVVKRTESAKLDKVRIEDDFELPSKEKPKPLNKLKIEKGCVKYYGGISDRLKEYKKRHNRMINLVNEYKYYFIERQYEEIKVKTHGELEKYLDNLKGNIDKFKRKKALQQISSMITQGETERIPKFIQTEFEAKRVKKPIKIIRKSHGKDNMKKINKLLEVLGRDIKGDVNAK